MLLTIKKKGEAGQELSLTVPISVPQFAIAFKTTNNGKSVVFALKPQGQETANLMKELAHKGYIALESTTLATQPHYGLPGNQIRYHKVSLNFQREDETQDDTKEPTN